jgi:predicted RecA/RadA family phage recombinase
MTVATSDNFEGFMDLVAPTGGVTVGVLVLVQGVVCLPMSTATATNSFVGKVFGRVKNAVATTSQVWAVGQKLYWISGTATLTTASTGNTLVGRAAAIKASAAAVGDIWLQNQ